MAEPLAGKGTKPTHGHRLSQDPSGHSATACLLFESCHAPLCPLDPVSMKGVWYADEEVCRSRSYTALPWIRSQRKIGRVKAR
jgi:hypothetical protein